MPEEVIRVRTSSGRGEFTTAGEQLGRGESERATGPGFTLDAGDAIVLVESGDPGSLATWLGRLYRRTIRHLVGDADLANLLKNLTPRAYPLTDGDREQDLSARHVVDLHGLTIDVRVTRHGLVVDLNADELPEDRRPVTVNLGDATLTDDGTWTASFRPVAPGDMLAAQHATTSRCEECGAETAGELFGSGHERSCSLHSDNVAP